MNSKFYFLLFVVLLVPVFVFAQAEPVYLVGIPGVPNIGTDFNSYINALYTLSIAVAALLAVIKIIIAGLKWMLTDLVTSKEDAKKDIQGAVLGLLIIIAAVIILETINPQLTKTQIFIAPSDSLDFSQNEVDNREIDCKSQYGDSAWVNMNGAMVCDPAQNEVLKEYGGFVKDYNCKPLGAAGSNQFDCSEVKAECERLGGRVDPYNAISTGVSLDFKITCTPLFELRQDCIDKGGTWDTNTKQCSI